jgi:hypothetical protein
MQLSSGSSSKCVVIYHERKCKFSLRTISLPWGPPSILYNGYGVFPGGKERPGRDADPSPPSSVVVMNE